MKNVYLGCALSLLAPATLSVAHAETLLTVQIPYPFVAAGVSMPAGTYMIHEMQPSGAMLLRGPGGRSVMIMSEPGAASVSATSAELVFHEVNGRRVLTVLRGGNGEQRLDSVLTK